MVPEYPQYSSTTSASIYDELFAQLRQYRNVPTIRIATPYYDHPAYIASLAAVTKAYLADKPAVEKHIISFHGIPERYHLRGDPYPWHCEQTALALAEAMGWEDSDWVMTYQSVFGKDPWLRPATDDTVAGLAKQGRPVCARASQPDLRCDSTDGYVTLRLEARLDRVPRLPDGLLGDGGRERN